MDTKSTRAKRHLTADDCEVLISAFASQHRREKPDFIGQGIVEILRTPRLRSALAALAQEKAACEALAEELEARFVAAGLM